MAILGSMLWLTRAELDSARIDLMRDFAVTPKRGPMDEEDPPPVEQFHVDPFKGLVGLPIYKGLEMWGERPLDEAYVTGGKLKPRRMPDPEHPKASPGQGQFFEDVLNAVTENDVVLAKAPTGSGKTVTALNTAGRLKKATVIVVPSRTLMDQWVEEIDRHLGIPPEDVGLIGDGFEDWEGKSIVVVILHNLFQREFPAEFYDHFGFAVWDEAHNLGAREFSKTMHCFPAPYKLALSATPDRKDGCEEVITNFFGPVTVESVQKALPIDCFAKHYHHPKTPHWFKQCVTTTKPIMWLAEQEGRNRLIVDLGCKLYDGGREILILTKFIDHAETLARLLVEEGIPREDIGLFVGQRTAVRATPAKRKILIALLRNMEHAPPVIYWWLMLVTRVKVKKEELAEAKNRPVRIGTFSMIKEGVDIPAIDAGIEAMPVADARQAIGRARRPLEGKPKPIWFSIVDFAPPKSGLEFLQGFANARFRGFRSVGVTVKQPKKKTA